VFVDNGSTDGSLELLEGSELPRARVLREPRRGFAEPLNRGVEETDGELLLFLDADAVPEVGWLSAMTKALASHDIAVGQTITRAPRKPTPYGRVAAKLFDGHSERTAHARGHALPWGPTCNLGVRRSAFEKAGPFSPEATSAFDIDWCWRAVLRGARLTYAGAARVKHARRTERRDLLAQFERYGLGEAWLHRTYAFLLAPEDQATDPLLAGVDAFRRLRHASEAAKVKSLALPLEEVAAAFAGGVRLGYERPHAECRLERTAPPAPVSWANGPESLTVFVPGKGLAHLDGKLAELWRLLEAGASDAELAKRFGKLFRMSESDARHGAEEFRRSFSP